MKKLKCPYCKNLWDYKGKMKILCRCTDCGKRVNIKESEIK